MRKGAGGAAEQTDKWFLLQYDLLFACHWSGPTKRQQFVRTEKIAPLARKPPPAKQTSRVGLSIFILRFVFSWLVEVTMTLG